MKRIFAIASLMSVTLLAAEAPVALPKEHRVFAGADIFWDQTDSKTTIGPLKQNYKSNSAMIGLRIGYDYLKTDYVYFGAHALVSGGHQSIHASVRPPLMRDKISGTRMLNNAEGRIGYTFKSPLFARATLTPFIGGGGYFNKQQKQPYFNWGYAAFGLRANFGFSEDLDVGTNLKVMNAFNDIWGFEAGLPLTWKMCGSGQCDFQLEPYYLRLDAKWPSQILGARFLFGYHF